MKFPIQIGTKLIEDLLNPLPEEIDYPAIQQNLATTYRFAGAEGALSVSQHQNLVVRMVELDRKNGFEDSVEGHQLWLDVCEWAGHHDDHEGVMGDTIAPVKSLIRSQTKIMEVAELALDAAIADHLGLKQPTETVRGLVHRYDKAAETIEWVWALGRKIAPHNHPCPAPLMLQGKQLIAWARGT